MRRKSAESDAINCARLTTCADYSDTACPHTLEILRRTLYINVNPDWTDEQVRVKVEALKAAAKTL